MRKAVLTLIAALFLTGMVPGPSPQLQTQSPQATLTFYAVNNLIVSETATATVPCENGRAFFVRTNVGCTGPSPEDVCNRYVNSGKTREYLHPGQPIAHWTGAVVGANWPANRDNAEYKIQPYQQAMDGPDYAGGCVDAIRFVKGANEFRLKSYSYFVFDLTQHRGCTVTKATLRYKVSPWYSGSAQPQSTTVHLGIYDMKHSCENLVNDEKRACFAALVNDATHNPLQLSSPIPSWNDDQPFSLDATQSVQADLNEVGASGYVGFMVGSDDIANAPGMRSLGVGEFVLTCEFGACQTLPPVVDSPPLTVPQLALGGGYQCVVQVNNKTGGTWLGTARLRRGNDLAWDTPWTLDGVSKTGSTEFDLSLDAGTTKKYVMGGDASARAGYLEFKGDPGFDPADLLISFFYALSGQGGALMDSTGTPVLPPATHFGFNVEKRGAQVNTGFAFAPYSAKSAFSILVALYDATGGLLNEKQLTYAGHYAKFFTETFSDVQLPNDFIGTVRLRSHQAIYLTSLRLDTPPGTVQLTSAPPQILLQLMSPAFTEGNAIPSAYTCSGANQSPPLTWTKAPFGTKSWALLVTDPDSTPAGFVHWILFNIDAGTRSLSAGAVPTGALQGKNGFSNNRYDGPCPPAGPQHRYVFSLYALDTQLSLTAGATVAQFLQAVEGHIVGTAQMLGVFVRSSS